MKVNKCSDECRNLSLSVENNCAMLDQLHAKAPVIPFENKKAAIVKKQ
jgi:predicted anti-sigma-YlaC factor YlaD